MPTVSMLRRPIWRRSSRSARLRIAVERPLFSLSSNSLIAERQPHQARLNFRNASGCFGAKTKFSRSGD
jgi:hypothetical protein